MKLWVKTLPVYAYLLMCKKLLAVSVKNAI
nr:unnamed protein product [Callosobruchus analis]